MLPTLIYLLALKVDYDTLIWFAYLPICFTNGYLVGTVFYMLTKKG